MLLAQPRYVIAQDVADCELTDLRAAWGAFLSRYTWDWFCTFTFRAATHPEAAFKYFRVWLSALNRTAHGVRWYKRGLSVYWCLAYERHQSGALHMHALIGNPMFDLNVRARRLQFMDCWFSLGDAGYTLRGSRRFMPARGPGFARIMVPNSINAVSNYCSAYVGKGTEIDLGGSIGRFCAT